MTTTNKILVVLTSQDQFTESHRSKPPHGGENNPKPPHQQQPESQTSTGFDVKEAAYVYTRFCQQSSSSSSCTIEFASPRGGQPPMDPQSEQASKSDPTVKKFLSDKQVKDLLSNTSKLSDIKNPSEYTAAVFVGGAGAMFDLAEDPDVPRITEKMMRENRQSVVAAIGHGIAALINVKSPQSTNDPLLKNKRVTCNTDEEEREMRLEDKVPFSLERKLKEIGAHVDKQEKFKEHVVVDERIITAQNRDSTQQWVERIAENLRM